MNATATMTQSTASTSGLTPKKTVKDVLSILFLKLNIGYDARDLELAESIIKQCQEKEYSAFKCATVIAEEMDFEPRFNCTHIEKALKENKIISH